MYLTINSFDELVGLVVELKKAGFLKDVGSKDVLNVFGEKRFPIQVPFNLDGAMGVIGNPVVKKAFGKKIETKVQEIWTKAAEAGR